MKSKVQKHLKTFKDNFDKIKEFIKKIDNLEY